MNSLFELLWYGYYYLSKTHTITTKDIISSPDEYFFKQSNTIIHLDETSLYTREELMHLIVRWKEEVKLKFYIHTYHSNYLLCYFLLDLLDLLSNECKDIQPNFELIFENPMKKDDFIKEIKLFLKSRLVEINKKKIIPIYSKFIEPFSLDMEYSLISNHQFNIIYIKELENGLSIQRIYFLIDL
jgi:hypothetical protein